MEHTQQPSQFGFLTMYDIINLCKILSRWGDLQTLARLSQVNYTIWKVCHPFLEPIRPRKVSIVVNYSYGNFEELIAIQSREQLKQVMTQHHPSEDFGIGKTLLHWCVQLGNLVFVKDIIDRYGPDPLEVGDDRGQIPILYALIMSRWDMVRLLLELGTPINLLVPINAPKVTFLSLKRTQLKWQTLLSYLRENPSFWKGPEYEEIINHMVQLGGKEISIDPYRSYR